MRAASSDGTPWLVRCASGREFVVYAMDEHAADLRWIRRPRCISLEERVSIEPHIVDHRVTVFDNRTAPGS